MPLLMPALCVTSVVWPVPMVLALSATLALSSIQSQPLASLVQPDAKFVLHFHFVLNAWMATSSLMACVRYVHKSVTNVLTLLPIVWTACLATISQMDMGTVCLVLYIAPIVYRPNNAFPVLLATSRMEQPVFLALIYSV